MVEGWGSAVEGGGERLARVFAVQTQTYGHVGVRFWVVRDFDAPVLSALEQDSAFLYLLSIKTASRHPQIE